VRIVVFPLLNGDQVMPPSRREVEAADERLIFLPKAGADGQILPGADVVLHVETELRL
jgi:hypothetical protein